MRDLTQLSHCLGTGGPPVGALWEGATVLRRVNATHFQKHVAFHGTGAGAPNTKIPYALVAGITIETQIRQNSRRLYLTGPDIIILHG